MEPRPLTEPKLFALVAADDHDSIYCVGVDTGDGAFTFRRDPFTRQSETGVWRSMTTAFARSSEAVKAYGGLALVIYESIVKEVVEYREGVCLTCNNEGRVSDGPSEIFPPKVAARYDTYTACSDCLSFGSAG